MKKRIVIKARTGYTLYGNWYEADQSSPVVFDYRPYTTKQDFKQFEKAMYMYRIDFSSISNWYIEENENNLCCEIKEEIK